MTAPCATIIETGIANTASVAAAFTRCGVSTEVTHDRERVESASLVVLPGVGAFGSGMKCLHESNLTDVMTQRIHGNRPTLAVCLGMQLLAQASVESPGVEGLGILDVEVVPMPEGSRVPQFGWNLVEPSDSCDLLHSGHAYFANSYRLARVPDGWSAAMARNDEPFIAAIERGHVLACQFHPELSGRWGLDLLKRWIARTREEASC